MSALAEGSQVVGLVGHKKGPQMRAFCLKVALFD